MKNFVKYLGMLINNNLKNKQNYRDYITAETLCIDFHSSEDLSSLIHPYISNGPSV